MVSGIQLVFPLQEESSLSLAPVNLSVIVAVQREKPGTYIVTWLAIIIVDLLAERMRASKAMCVLVHVNYAYIV